MSTTGRWRTAALGVLLVVITGFVALAPAPAGAQTTTTEISNSARSTTAPPKGWILVDATSGVILDGAQIHEPLRPASTVKLMTALTVTEHLPSAATVTVSELASRQPSRRLGVEAGSTFSVHDFLYALLLGSANDVAYALAERTGGDLDGFAALMTQTGARLGLQDSTFKDPAGLDAPNEGYEGGSYMSAYDLAVVARNVLADPFLGPIVATRTYTFAGVDEPIELINHNVKLMDEYEGANGLKTGFTERAGRTLVASAERDGRTIIAVVLDTYNVNTWVMNLLDQGFATPADSPGLGESLPAVDIRSAEVHAQLLSGLPLLLGRPATQVAQATPDAAATAAATAPADATPPAADAGDPAGEATRPVESAPVVASNAAAASEGGLSRVTVVVIAVVLLLLTLVTLRVRAVNRRRRRRARRLKQFHDARRRGALTVLDHEQWTQASHVRTVTSRR